ncbi:MAG: maleylpyruvate isomerase N-terminal domain-containing protein [Anaerolineaceae bacterium]
MAEKLDTLATLETKYAEFREKISGLPADAYDEVWLGEWNLAQLLAHLAGWFGEMTVGLKRVANGERPTPEGVDYSDADAWNAKFAATASPGAASLSDFDSAYAGYRDAANALPEDKFGVDPQTGKPRIGLRLLDGPGIHHFDEHLPEIEEWLSKRNPG